jgi:hypothetical protein
MRTEAEIRRALDAARHWMNIIAELAKARDSILTDDEETDFKHALMVASALAWALGEESDSVVVAILAIQDVEAYIESVKLKLLAEMGFQINPIGGVQ